MTRIKLKPSTRKKIEELGEKLRIVSDDLEGARPFLATLYRTLASELWVALMLPDAPFTIELPVGARVETQGSRVTIYPANFEYADYWKRVAKAASRM